MSTCRCLEIFQFFSACLACLEVCKQLKFLFHVFWEDEGMEQLVSFLELIRRDSLLYYWKSAKSAPALCSPPSQPHQFFQFFRRRVAQHQLLSSGGCKFKKEKTSSNGCFRYWECCSAFLLYTRPKKVQMSFEPRLIFNSHFIVLGCSKV